MKIFLNGYVLALVSVFFWSFNVLIAHYLSNQLTPFQIAFGRWFVAALVLLPLTAKSVWNNRKILWIHRKHVFVSALIAVVLQNTIVYQAGRTASVINMALLGTMAPIFLVIFSKIFLHTSISVKQIIGFGIALLGVLIIISKGRLNDLLHIPVVPGDFWMLFMTVIFGAYGVLQTRKTDVPALTLLGAMVFIGVLILTPVFLITLWTDPVRHLTTEAVVIVIYMGVCPSIISYLCWDISLEKIGALKTGLLYYLMPVFSSIEAYFIIGEKMSAAQLCGGILVVSGVFIAAYHHAKHQLAIHRV